MMSADAFDHTPAHSVEIVNNVNFADLIVALFILLLLFFVIIVSSRPRDTLHDLMVSQKGSRWLSKRAELPGAGCAFCE